MQHSLPPDQLLISVVTPFAGVLAQGLIALRLSPCGEAEAPDRLPSIAA